MTTQTNTTQHQQFIEELSKKMLVEKVTDPVLLKTIYNVDRVRSNLEAHLNKTVVDVEFYLIQPNSLVEHQSALVVYREVPNIKPEENTATQLDFKTVNVPADVSDQVIVALSQWLFVPQTTTDLKSDIFVKTDSWIHFYIARSNSVALKPELTPRDPFIVRCDALHDSFAQTAKEIDKLYMDLDKYLLNKHNVQEYLINGKAELV